MTGSISLLCPPQPLRVVVGITMPTRMPWHSVRWLWLRSATLRISFTGAPDAGDADLMRFVLVPPATSHPPHASSSLRSITLRTLLRRDAPLHFTSFRSRTVSMSRGATQSTSSIPLLFASSHLRRTPTSSFIPLQSAYNIAPSGGWSASYPLHSCNTPQRMLSASSLLLTLCILPSPDAYSIHLLYGKPSSCPPTHGCLSALRWLRRVPSGVV